MNKIFRGVFKTNGKKLCSNYRFSTGAIYRDNSQKTSPVKFNHQYVSDFYAGKSVFITGATGFIGRVLVERLLYTCKDIEKVYILLRPKGGTLQQRFQDLLSNPIFTKLKETRPQDLSKIVPIAGDVGDIRLGINLEDEQALIEEVSVVFHSAANVKFRAPLSDLLQVNYEGTRSVLELAKKIKNIDVYVHVSTLFHNSKNHIVGESVRQPPGNIEDVYKANYSIEANEVKSMLGDWGNTYLLSKQMGEAYIPRGKGNLPTVIVRPSMVTSVYKEPLKGYTDSWVAGTGLLCDIASGLTRVVYGSKSVVVELIPVDYVCNFLIVAAAKSKRSQKCVVYNYSTGPLNPIQWRKLTDIYIKEGKTHGYVVMPFPMAYFTKARWAMPLLIFVTQIVPAFIGDIWLRLTGRQPRYIKLQKKAIARMDLSNPATVLSWDVKTTRTTELLSTLNDEDRHTFPCDPRTIDWDEYVPIYCKGVKDHMLKRNNIKNK